MPSLLSKPSSCHGCPLYGNGQGFVPDELVEGAEVMVCGQNPGKYEESGLKVTGGRAPHYITEPTTPRPYTGPTGQVMEREYFPIAGLERGKVSVVNALRCRWQNSDELPDMKTEVARKALEHCYHAHFKLPSSTRLIVAEGAWALYALTGEGLLKDRTIDSWRGYVLPFNPVGRPTLHHNNIWTPSSDGVTVLATYHLSYLFRAPWERPASQRDWSKVPLILSRAWPERMPELLTQPPLVWPGTSAFDTEFEGWETGNKHLTRYSMAHEDGQGPRVYVVEAADAGTVPVKAGSTVILQNEMADLDDMNKVFGGVEVKTEDTMLAHSVLWPDLSHDLNFLGSLYARTNRWKHLNHSNPKVYAGGDALGTLDVWVRGLRGELARDPGSDRVYREYVKPLVSIILNAKRHGVKPNQQRVAEVIKTFGSQMDDAQAMATAAVGWPINIGSPAQVTEWLYSGAKIQINPISGKVRR